MLRYILSNKTKNIVIARNVLIANTFGTRLLGLLSKRGLGCEEGLVITECKSIHMFFMKFSIDVVFVDRAYRVVGLVQNIKPFQLSPFFFKANKAIELCSGCIQQKSVSINDLLVIEKNPT